MSKLYQSFSINSINGTSIQFLACCQEMESLLNQYVLLQSYSNIISCINFSFTFGYSSFSHTIQAYPSSENSFSIDIHLPIDHPYFLFLDEDNMKQLMIEGFLEAVIVVTQHDNAIDEGQFYNDIKTVFYKNGWLTRVIFPAQS